MWAKRHPCLLQQRIRHFPWRTRHIRYRPGTRYTPSMLRPTNVYCYKHPGTKSKYFMITTSCSGVCHCTLRSYIISCSYQPYSPHYFKSCKISAVALIKMVRQHPTFQLCHVAVIVHELMPPLAIGYTCEIRRSTRNHGPHARKSHWQLDRDHGLFCVASPRYRNAC